MASSKIIRPSNGVEVLVDPSSPHELTNALTDLGNEIAVSNVDSVGIAFTVDIGTSTNVRISALGKMYSSLEAGCRLAKDIRDKLNAHYNDATEHTSGIQANVTSGAEDFPSLVKLVSELLVSYEASDADAELGAAWLYHVAQETNNASLIGIVAPTNLAECHVKLEDLRAKMLIHFADGGGTPHTTGDSTPVTFLADKEYYLPIRSVSASDVKVEDEYIELNVDADQSLILEVDTNGIIKYVQFQVIDADDGTGQIDDALITFNKRVKR